MKEIVIQNIKEELKIRNLTIQDLCTRLGTSRNFINQLRDGTPLHKIVRISRAIGCSPCDLMRNL